MRYLDDNDDLADRLRRLRVLVLGVGGIGLGLAAALARVQLGHITLVDGDTVERVNLPRQSLLSDADIGEYKVIAARRRLLDQYPSLSIKALTSLISTKAALLAIVRDHDFVFQAAETPPNIMDLVDDICFGLGIGYCGTGYYNLRLVAGPQRVPGQTGCCQCEGVDLTLRPGTFQHRFLAASFGPYNTFIASYAVIAYLSLVATGTSPILGRQMEYDVSSGIQVYHDCPRIEHCSRCHRWG